MPKEKLTLSVDEDVVRKAKEFGINISEITESVLRGFTASRNEADAPQIRTAYDSLFKAMMPVMERFDVSVEVGSEYDPEGDGQSILNLTPDNRLYWWHDPSDTATYTSLDKVRLWALHDPAKIVSNWLARLKEAKAQGAERLRTVQLYQGIVEAMAKNLATPQPSKKSKALKPSRSIPRGELSREKITQGPSERKGGRP